MGKYEELSDGPRWSGIREYALELLQKRAIWWQPASVATGRPSATTTLTPLFYRIHINEITGHKAMPDSLEEIGLKAAAQLKLSGATVNLMG